MLRLLTSGLSKTSSGSELGKLPSAPSSKQDNSLQHPPPAVTHIDTSMVPLPETDTSSSQSLLTTGGGGVVESGDEVNKGFPLESSVDPPSLSTYMSSPLTSLTSSGGNTPLSMPVGNFGSYGSQKLISPAEFVSSPPHSLTTFPKVTPSDFSSALPLSISSAATPTSAAHTTIAPPPMTSSTTTEVTLDSTTSDSDDDGNVTPQGSARKSFQDICDSLDLPKKPNDDLPKMSPEQFLQVVSEPVFNPAALEGNTNKTSTTSQLNPTNEDEGSLQKGDVVLQVEGRVSQASSDFASAKDQEESDGESLGFVSNEDGDIMDTEPKTPPASQQLFPDALPLTTDQQVITAQVYPSTSAPSLRLSSIVTESPSTTAVAFKEGTNTAESAVSDGKMAEAVEAVVNESSQDYSMSHHSSASLPVMENSNETRSDVVVLGGQTVTTEQESYTSSR